MTAMEAKGWCAQKPFAENPFQPLPGQSLLGESNYSNHLATHMRKIHRSDKFPMWEVEYDQKKREGLSTAAQLSCCSSASICPILAALLEIIVASQDNLLLDEKSSVRNDECSVSIHTCEWMNIYGKAT